VLTASTPTVPDPNSHLYKRNGKEMCKKYEMIKMVENINATTILLPSSNSLAPLSNPD